MGIFDQAKDLAGRAKDLAGEHADQVEEGVEKAGDFVDEKTGGKFSGQVDQAQEFVEKQVGDQNQA